MSSRPYAYARATCLAFALLIGAVATLDLIPSISSAVEFGKREPLTIVTSKGNSEFKVEIADNDAQREHGLMFRRIMPADEGMLFDFKVSQPVYFWMKNTYLPLDMIFIEADGTVAHIAENTTPFSEKEVASGKEVRFVLEVNAGVSQRIGLKDGDKVQNRLMQPNAN